LKLVSKHFAPQPMTC